jgi:hypothetical protein
MSVMPGQREVGELYLGEYRNGLKVWSQPGGVGTPVFPQLPTQYPSQNQGYPQVAMAYPAQYYLGCGHPSNCLEIFSYYDPYAEEVMALICCGQCSYIQVIQPYTTYQNYLDVPIVVA